MGKRGTKKKEEFIGSSDFNWQHNMVNGFRFPSYRINRKGAIALSSAVALFLYWNILPDVLFNKPVSLVVFDKQQHLLGAMISTDGQWRFPADTTVPEKFARCIITFEDKRIYEHPGVDILSVGRALTYNLTEMRTVSGASTITMQVIRLSRNKERTLIEKGIEALMATRLEMKYTKKEILAHYVSNAPFGGNVVGLSAASWRYYGKSPENLSWGESATLAVLPNSPSLIHPGKNRAMLRAKRDRLLNLLVKGNWIDSSTCALAMLESLPDRPQSLPELAPHFVTRLYNERVRQGKAMEVVHSTLDIVLQKKVNGVLNFHGRRLQEEGIHNAAVVVADVKTGGLLAYCGNIPHARFNKDVDNVVANRSTGSVLKPLLYASMLDEGLLLPDMMIPDVPTFTNNYTPKNFNSTYDGVVPASRALSRSLNIPAVHMLQEYTPERFLYRLKKMGFTTMHRSASAYGLSLILGGAEANLEELVSVYSAMARTVEVYNRSGKYRKNEFSRFHYIRYADDTTQWIENPPLSAGAVYATFSVLLEVARPDEERFWTVFSSGRKIAWKTGTSFGNRDAWAVGCTPDFVVGIWVGNSSGEGRPDMTGIRTAAPILFDVFNLLPSRSEWFEIPVRSMRTIGVCAESGFAASDLCSEIQQRDVPISKGTLPVCPYHHAVYLSSDLKFRVHSDCEAVSEMVRKVWFVLPPSIEKYYKAGHPTYLELPSYRSDCQGILAESGGAPVELIYPKSFTRIKIPRGSSGERSVLVFEAVHHNLSASLYWHIDEKFIGKTCQGMHEKSLEVPSGIHKLTLVDDAGYRVEQDFEIVD